MQHLHPTTLAQDFANLVHMLRDRFADRTISIQVHIITLSSVGEHVIRYDRETRYSYESGVIAQQPQQPAAQSADQQPNSSKS